MRSCSRARVRPRRSHARIPRYPAHAPAIPATSHPVAASAMAPVITAHDAGSSLIDHRGVAARRPGRAGVQAENTTSAPAPARPPSNPTTNAISARPPMPWPFEPVDGDRHPALGVPVPPRTRHALAPRRRQRMAGHQPTAGIERPQLGGRHPRVLEAGDLHDRRAVAPELALGRLVTGEVHDDRRRLGQPVVDRLGRHRWSGPEPVLLEPSHRTTGGAGMDGATRPARRSREHVEHRADLVPEDLADDHPRRVEPPARPANEIGHRHLALALGRRRAAVERDRVRQPIAVVQAELGDERLDRDHPLVAGDRVEADRTQERRLAGIVVAGDDQVLAGRGTQRPRTRPPPWAAHPSATRSSMPTARWR